jgi:hypothetical protein
MKRLKKWAFSIMRGVTATGLKGRVRMANNRFESDGLPFRCAPGQAAVQVER